MKKTAFIFLLTILSVTSNAQWKKIADFVGTDGSLFTGDENVTCVYFLDLPGPPRIGFVGTESELHKTTDGGVTWHSVWDSGWSFEGYYVSDICFKDSLTGWFSVMNTGGITGDECYRTTDGGETWNKLNVPGVYYSLGEGVFYSDSSKKLFLISDTLIRVSNDLGDSWSDSLPYYAVFSFSFSSPLKGILPVNYYPDTTQGFIITSDGGITWDTTHSYLGDEVLSIPETQTCFLAGGEWAATIFRSDDGGRIWRPVGRLLDTLPYYTGVIRGDLSRLYVQSDTGMYVSMDSGATWQFDSGPPYLLITVNDEFYSAKGVTIAGMVTKQNIANGLWEETWPQAGVKEQEPSASSRVSVYPNPTSGAVTVSGMITALSVTNVLGQTILPQSTTEPVLAKNGGISLDLATQPPGMYFLRIQTANNETETLKIVKQ